MLVADLSGSVQGKEPFIVDALNAFIDRFTLSENDVKIGIVTFNDRAYMMSGLSSDKNYLHDVANSITQSGGMTNMTDALFVSANELMEHGRIGTYKLIIMISDGENNRGDCVQAADGIKQLNGIGICSIVIKTSETNTRLMSEISSGCYEEAGYENLLTVLKKMDICL